MPIDDLKTLFVTGGGGGIGLEIGRICARRGMNVVLADIHRERLDATVTTFDGPVLGIVMDVSSFAEWARAKQEAEARFGAVDLLVNGAALPPGMSSILDMPVADFETRIATNLSGVFYGVRTFGANMRARGYGHIVNIASEAGLVPMAMLGDYGAAKFGVVGLSGILRIELAPSGVGVTVVAPGLTRSNMTVGMGMDARYVAAAIVEGVRDNAPFIITHPNVRAALEKVHARQIAAIGAPAQPGYENAKTRWE
ncbi:SDR family oxidoreductase [uncultured Sphingomonas sp.]|uniref:SDR family oxidoreductase n=1 Tax=uncultured Sphingomonas sp. TaxID=158754 RepID=UPI0035CA5768